MFFSGVLIITTVIGVSGVHGPSLQSAHQASTCAAQTSKKAAAQLKISLLTMGKADQDVRTIFSQKKFDDFTPEEVANLQKVDGVNLSHLKDIIQQCGWPTTQLVGRDGVDAAFIVLQHGDHAFQKQMLPTIETAFKRHQLSGQDYALFVDRVLVGDGQLQKYGTQLRFEDGQVMLEPIEDELHVDQRRANYCL